MLFSQKTMNKVVILYSQNLHHKKQPMIWCEVTNS